jgi:hypothetical protein
VRSKSLLYSASSFSMLFLFSLPLFSCTSKPEESKSLVKISNVKVWRSNEHILTVTLDYDLEPGVKLPLPYKEVLVFPLEPQVKLGGTIEPFILSVGSVAVSLELPPDSGIHWENISDQDTCCIVSLKGVIEDPHTKASRYERISNEIRVLPPARSS